MLVAVRSGACSTALTEQNVNNRRCDRSEVRRKTGIVLPAILFASLLSLLWVRIGVTEANYQAEALRLEQLELDATLRQKELDLAYVMRPISIANEAKTRLKFEETPPQRVRVITENFGSL